MTDDEDYINFGDFSRKVLGMQSQYGSRFLTGLPPYPNLSEGLRIKGNASDYHTVKIHKDDAIILKKRIEKWEKSKYGRK